MKKDNHLTDVTHRTAEEYADLKIPSLEDLMEMPAGALLESLIASIVNPEQGNGRPACMKIRHNGVIVSLLISILDAKVVGAGNETVN